MSSRHLAPNGTFCPRPARENLFARFARFAVTYAASRLQGQRFLQAAGIFSIIEWRGPFNLSDVGPGTIRGLAGIHRTDHLQLSRDLPAMRDKEFVNICATTKVPD